PVVLAPAHGADDVRMPQRAYRREFLVEPFGRLGRQQDVPRADLEGGDFARGAVADLVDRGTAANTNLGNHFKWTEYLPRCLTSRVHGGKPSGPNSRLARPRVDDGHS